MQGLVAARERPADVSGRHGDRQATPFVVSQNWRSPMNAPSLIRQPSAFLPILMSLAALGTVLLRVALVGTAPEPDEGAAANIWQLVMALQLPVISLFAVKWLPRTPGQALIVLGLQAGGVFVALAPVFILHW
jgi:hypothetical protein